jgi:APA family basic amino acid/polyamine antiporter
MQALLLLLLQNRLHFSNSALTIAIIAGYTSVMLVMLMGQSRVFYSMSVDGLLPKFSVHHIQKKQNSKTNLLFMIFVSVFAGFPVSDLDTWCIGTLFAFALVCIGVIVMRKPILMQKEGSEYHLCLPIVGVIICLILMAGLPIVSWERLAIWMVIIAYLFHERNSVLNNPTKKVQYVSAKGPNSMLLVPFLF